MALRLGILLPTRERIMQSMHETDPLLDLAQQAERSGFDSVWVGDSLLARPRHEPLTLLAALAARTSKVALGTAVLLPALRNPVHLAHLVATVDRLSHGRVILGVGIAADLANIRAEFAAAEAPFAKRVGRLMEGLRLCRALWRGEPVTWQGRWALDGQTLAPTPHRAGGPPIWVGSHVRAGMQRAGKYFDGWFPTGPNARAYAEQLAIVRDEAVAANRNPDDITPAIYLTMRIDEDPQRANQHIDQYLRDYYGVDPQVMRRQQACFAGNEHQAIEWLNAFVDAGAQHLVIRLAGDHERQLQTLVRIRSALQTT